MGGFADHGTVRYLQLMTAKPRTAQPNPRSSVAVDDRLLRDADALDIDVSMAAEAGIARAVQAARRADEWARENADIVASNNAYIAEHGLPLQKYRIR